MITKEGGKWMTKKNVVAMGSMCTTPVYLPLRNAISLNHESPRTGQFSLVLTLGINLVEEVIMS